MRTHLGVSAYLRSGSLFFVDVLALLLKINAQSMPIVSTFSAGALASPRASRGCHIAATLTAYGMAPEGSEMRALGDGISNEVSSDRIADSGNPEKHQETTPVDEASAPTNQAGGRFEAAATVPHDLGMMLREELDVSCRLGCHAARGWNERMEDNEGFGSQEAEGGSSGAGLLGADE